MADDRQNEERKWKTAEEREWSGEDGHCPSFCLTAATGFVDGALSYSQTAQL